MSADDLRARLGDNMRAIRSCQGLSQEALAQSCGLHRTYIGAVERGERNITLQTLQKIASALSIDPLDLLQEPEQWMSHPPRQVNESPS